jgi:hypothetical protein
MLLWTGWLNIALLVAMAAIAPFDHRTVMGINPWIKPMKFAISIAIYAWTLAWLLRYLPRPQRAISWGVSAVMMVEIVCIALQAARGTTSHFNDSTPFDAIVFTIMGIAVAVNTVLIGRLLWLVSRPLKMPAAMLWGVRLGLVMFLIASLEGAVMLGHQAHTVGLADGGEGLPFVNWSTQGGDLRIAHFIGLHSLQLLPLAGWLLTQRWPRAAVRGVFALFGVSAAVFAAALMQALAGRPLL